VTLNNQQLILFPTAVSCRTTYSTLGTSLQLCCKTDKNWKQIAACLKLPDVSMFLSAAHIHLNLVVEEATPEEAEHHQ